MTKTFILSTALVIAAGLFSACGGTASNANNATANRNSNMPMMNSNTTSNSMSNMPSNTMSNMMNTAANKPTNANSTTKTPPAPANANKVETTKKPPKGATALCKDGTYSFATNSSGQCSGHGGVDKKY